MTVARIFTSIYKHIQYKYIKGSFQEATIYKFISVNVIFAICHLFRNLKEYTQIH